MRGDFNARTGKALLIFVASHDIYNQKVNSTSIILSSNYTGNSWHLSNYIYEASGQAGRQAGVVPSSTSEG